MSQSDPVRAMSDTHLVQTMNGPMWVFRADQYVSRSLEVYGEYGADEQAIFEQIVHPGMTVVEAGANLGSHSAALARMCAPGPAYFFEPQQRVFQLLCANLALSGVRNAHAYPEGLGETDGVAELPNIDYGTANNFGSVSLTAARTQSTLTARVTPLDRWQLPALDFLKIDVEGWELQVLRGAAQTIARYRPIIYTENDRAAHQGDVIAQLERMGYRAYWHVAPLFRPDNYNLVKQDIFNNTVALNMIAVPKGDPRQFPGFELVDPQTWRSPIRPVG